MTPSTGDKALSLPRALAFGCSLLVPVSRSLLLEYGIPAPLRFTAAAWSSLIDAPIATPRGSRPPDRPTIHVRLARFLAFLRTGLDSPGLRSHLLTGQTFVLVAASPAFVDHPAVSVAVLLTQDDEGADVLTVLAPEESCAVM